jgi:hypothetical protein
MKLKIFNLNTIFSRKKVKLMTSIDIGILPLLSIITYPWGGGGGSSGGGSGGGGVSPGPEVGGTPPGQNGTTDSGSTDGCGSSDPGSTDPGTVNLPIGPQLLPVPVLPPIVAD